MGTLKHEVCIFDKSDKVTGLLDNNHIPQDTFNALS